MRKTGLLDVRCDFNGWNQPVMLINSFKLRFHRFWMLKALYIEVKTCIEKL